MKKFIFFRNDRLGDFIILTNIIRSIKKKYKNSHITILCSPLNYNLIKKYEIIDKIYIYSSFDEKKYELIENDSNFIFNYETEDYISILSINSNLDLDFSISYKEFDKNWSYELKCVSLKK